MADVYIREARAADAPALNHICLLTGDAGQSAAPLHAHGELIGLMYADPYVHLPATCGFVLVDRPTDAVVGYIVGAHDTRAFEQAARAAWWPRVRAAYAYPPEGNAGAGTTEADRRYIELLYNPPCAPQAAVEYSPAHMHVDILPDYQRQGWGHRLLARLVEHLRDRHGLERLWLKSNVRNEGARRFYDRVGFKELAGAPAGTLGLEFKDFE